MKPKRRELPLRNGPTSCGIALGTQSAPRADTGYLRARPWADSPNSSIYDSGTHGPCIISQPDHQA